MDLQHFRRASSHIIVSNITASLTWLCCSPGPADWCGPDPEPERPADTRDDRPQRAHRLHHRQGRLQGGRDQVGTTRHLNYRYIRWCPSYTPMQCSFPSNINYSHTPLRYWHLHLLWSYLHTIYCTAPCVNQQASSWQNKDYH